MLGPAGDSVAPLPFADDAEHRLPDALTRFCHNLSNGGVSINAGGMWGGRKVERWMTNPLNPEQEHFRGVAEKLRGLAAQMPYDIRGRDQLLALADGFERFAERLDLQAADE
jgi:hypothetical protein